MFDGKTSSAPENQGQKSIAVEAKPLVAPQLGLDYTHGGG